MSIIPDTPAEWRLRDAPIDASTTPSTEPWHPFPLEVFPPIMRHFAAETGRTLCVDPVMAALPMISIAGATIGNAASAKMSADYYAPPNVWSAVAVRSGDRKSPVLRAIMRPLYDRQGELAEQHAQVVAEYESRISEWKSANKKLRGDEPLAPPSFPHLYLTDTTTEAIAIRLMEQRRGLPVVYDELGGLFAGLNQYKKSGNDRETYLAFYDAGAAKIDRKTSTPPTIFIPRAFVTVTGMIQTAMLARAMGSQEFDSGMVARFLLASPPPMTATWIGDGIPESVRDAWRDSLFRILSLSLPEHPTAISPTPGAMRLWALAHDRLESDRHAERDDRMRAARAKLIGVIPRLSLIFETMTRVLDDDAPCIESIGEHSMRSAIEVSEWCCRETRRVYGMLAVDHHDAEDDIIRRIESNAGCVTTRELMHWSRQFRGSAKAAESYLDSLAHDGIGRWIWRQTGGRPSRVFSLLTSGNGNDSLSDTTENAGSVTVTTIGGKR